MNIQTLSVLTLPHYDEVYAMPESSVWLLPRLLVDLSFLEECVHDCWSIHTDKNVALWASSSFCSQFGSDKPRALQAPIPLHPTSMPLGPASSLHPLLFSLVLHRQGWFDQSAEWYGPSYRKCYYQTILFQIFLLHIHLNSHINILAFFSTAPLYLRPSFLTLAAPSQRPHVPTCDFDNVTIHARSA